MKMIKLIGLLLLAGSLQAQDQSSCISTVLSADDADVVCAISKNVLYGEDGIHAQARWVLKYPDGRFLEEGTDINIATIMFITGAPEGMPPLETMYTEPVGADGVVTFNSDDSGRQVTLYLDSIESDDIFYEGDGDELIILADD